MFNKDTYKKWDQEKKKHLTKDTKKSYKCAYCGENHYFGSQISNKHQEYLTQGKKKDQKKQNQEIEIPSLQKRNQLGRWVDVSNPKEFLKDLSKWKNISTNEIIKKLENKEEFYYDTEWYAKLRIKPSKEQEKKQKELIETSQRKTHQYQKNEEKKYWNEVGKYEKM